MNDKAQKFSELLKKNEIECFQVEELTDEFHSDIYRSQMEIAGQKLATVVVIDDSIYTMVGVQIAAGAVNAENKLQVMEYINELNSKFKIIKYSIDADGNILLNACLCNTNESFEPELIRAVLDVVIKHLTEYYPNIMKQIWG